MDQYLPVLTFLGHCERGIAEVPTLKRDLTT